MGPPAESLSGKSDGGQKLEMLFRNQVLLNATPKSDICTAGKIVFGNMTGHVDVILAALEMSMFQSAQRSLPHQERSGAHFDKRYVYLCCKLGISLWDLR